MAAPVPVAKLKRRVDQEPRSHMSSHSSAVPTQRAQPPSHPYSSSAVSQPASGAPPVGQRRAQQPNHSYSSSVASRPSSSGPTAPRGIPLPALNDTPLSIHRFFAQHECSADWTIHIGPITIRIHMWWRAKAGTEQENEYGGQGATWRVSMGRSEATLTYRELRYRREKGNFFKTGVVFAVPWPDSPGDCISGTESQSKGIEEQQFIVLQSDQIGCFALPISTYSGQGVGRQGVVKQDHGIVHSSKKPPPLLRGEAPSRGEEGLQNTFIRVVMSERDETLSPESRINYSQVCFIRFDTLVRGLGRVDTEHVTHLISTYQRVLSRRRDVVSRVVDVTSSSSSGSGAIAPKRDSGIGSVRSGRSSTSSTDQHNFNMANMGATLDSHEQAPSSDAELKKVIDTLSALKQYALQHGYSMPKITQEQVDYLARDEAAFKRWATELRTRWEAAQDDQDDDDDESSAEEG